MPFPTPRPFARSPAAAVALVGLFLLSAGTAAAQNPLTQDGLFVTVANPITSDAVTRIKNRVEQVRHSPGRAVKTVVFEFNPNGKEANTPDYGVCYSLAAYIASLHELTTVGFVSANVSGHTVLPVLACKEVVMSKSAVLGEILPPGQSLPRSVEAGYDEILGEARAPLRAVVRKMADRGVSLGKGEKKDFKEFFFDLNEREAFVKSGGRAPNTSPLPFAGPGAAGVFPYDKAKQLGLVKRSLESRADIAADYGLSPASLKDDPLDGRAPVGFRYVLRGAIDNGVKEATRRVIQDVVRQKGNVLFVQLECGDGDLSAARDIADEFQKAQQGEDGILVVGFLPESATPAASVIALGCGELVMSKRTDAADAGGEAPEAEVCDFEPVLARGDAGAVEFLRKNLKELAAARQIPELLIDGMLDRELEIVRVRAANDRSKVRLMTGEEFEASKPQWVPMKVEKPKGQLLKLNATRAVELGVARKAIEGRDIAEVYAFYGVKPGDVREVTPGWLDRFATFLRLPAVTVLLVVIGFAGLILELKVPGTTVPGIVAALCFILIFWAHTGVNGNAVILGALLFLLGLVLILIEVFVLPGFGAPGILGVLFMLGGVGLATLDRIPQSGGEWTEFGGKIGLYLLAMIGSMVLAIFAARFLPKMPYANRMFLPPPDERPDADGGPDLPGAALAAALLGAVGTAATTLRPAGMAQFGDQYVDVVTEGGFIAGGARVQVVEVEGTRVVVREV